MKLNRRQFLSTAATLTAGFTIVPAYAVSGLGYKAPSDKLNIAGIGVGGKGSVNLRNMNTENIVALCDVDFNYARNTFNEYPKAKRFFDFREMLDISGKEIDAVVIATPDHTHAVAAIACMQLGKHVYVQKPLTHSVYESRQLLLASRKYKVVTQMGNEGHSDDSVREVYEAIHAGAIGDVYHCDAWTDRPIWPQGLSAPKDTMPVPENMRWDIFIGPAKMRPYHRAYHPWDWRGWWDFGTGALGDMACHVLDVLVYVLDPGHPVSVEASSTAINTQGAPVASTIHYEFPARKKAKKINMPPLTVTWYDGGLLPKRPEGLPDGQMINIGSNGVIFHGTKGTLICDNYGANWTLLPYSGNEKNRPSFPKTQRRIGMSHEQDFVRACKESPANRVLPSSNFEYSGPLNEMVVMGNLAIRLQGLGKRLMWDGEAMKITNIGDSETFRIANGSPEGERTLTLNAKEAAEEYINHHYREGWSLTF